MPQYTVTFVDWDGTVISAADYDEGTSASGISVPSDPSRSHDGTYKYTFAGWTPAFADVMENATYTATYTAAPLMYYNVTFVDYDGTTVLQAETSYPEGTAASDITQPATPTRASDGTYTYTFSGWSPALSEVTGDVIYAAVYDSEKNKYTITWYPYGTSYSEQTIVEHGETPVHADPSMEPTAQYTYTFTGWTPSIVPATEDASYTATYSYTTRQYNVTFVDWDGTELQAATAYDYGTAAADITVPSGMARTPTAQYDYAFSGWSPELAATVTEDVTYTAQYTETLRQYTVAFENWDGTPLSSASYDYGTAAASIVQPSTPTKPDDSAGSYTFTGWSPTIADVTGDATYTAQFSLVTSNVPPTIDDITNTAYDHYSAGSLAHFEPVVTLNDVAGSTGRFKLLHKADPDASTWTEETLGTDWNFGATIGDFKYDDGSDWVAMESPSDLNAQYDIPDDAVSLRVDMGRYLIPPGGWGAIREKEKVAFDYTLPDGTTGTIESNEFFLYRGSFAQRNGAPVLDRDAKTITMEFVYRLVDGYGTIDPDKVTWTGHHLYWKDKADDSEGPGTEITGLADPEVTHSDVDGVHHVTVTYTLDSINDAWKYTYVGDVLDDEWGDPSHWNNWQTTANSYNMEFPAATHTAPLALEPGPAVSHSYGGDSEDYTVGFMMMSKDLNDAKGGKIALRIERYDEGSGSWVSPDGGFVSHADWEANNAREWDDPNKQYIYDAQTIWSVTVGTANAEDPIEPSDPTTLDIDNPTQLFEVGDHTAVYAVFMYHFPYGYWYGTRITLRTVMDVEYPDGTTETIASTPFYVYGGSFVESNTDFGNNGMQIDKASKTLTLEYYYANDAVEIVPSDVRWVSDSDEIANNNYLYYAVGYTGWWPASRSEDWDQLEYLDIKPTASERDEGGKHYVTLTFDLSGAPAEVWADPYSTYLFYMGSAWYQDHTGEYFGVWQASFDKGYISVGQFVD